MGESAYHWDALRKERILQRKNEARKRLEEYNRGHFEQNPEQSGYPAPEDNLITTDQGEFAMLRNMLPMFRVKKEGHDNRYRNRQSLAPHCDEAFPVMYPATENPDYICDQNKKNMRMNVMIDRYDMTRKVNGDFHMQVLEATPE